MDIDKSKFLCVYSSIDNSGNIICTLSYTQCNNTSCEYSNDCKYCIRRFKSCNDCHLPFKTLI